MKPQTLFHVASLARLSLSEEEQSTLLPELRALVALADTLADDAVALPPSQAPQARLREDVPAPFDAHASILAAAPHAEDGCFAVPRVIKEESCG